MASMIDGFIKNEASVSLLSLNTLKHHKSDTDIAKEKPATLHFEKVDVNTDIKPLGALMNLLSGDPYHVSRFYQKSFAERLQALLKEQKFDIIQLEGLSMAVYLDLIRENSDAPIALRAHNVEHQIWERHIQSLNNLLQKAYLNLQVKRLKKFEWQTLSEVDAVVAITKQDQQGFKAVLPQLKSIAIPCGIDLQHKKTNTVPAEGKVDLGYLASFDWMPNVQGLEWFLNEVWPLVKKARPNTTFQFGGRHMPPSFQNLNEEGIAVYPDVPDMAKFVCKSKVQVIPLLAGSGMRIKIIENMALGICQVSTSVGAEGIAIKNGYDILIGDSPDEFSQQILEALNQSDLIQSIGQNARHTIEEQYDNAALGKQLLTFYSDQLC